MAGVGLIWDLIAKDSASPAFLRVAGAADKAAASTAKATLGMQASVAKMGRAGAALSKKVTLPLLAIGAVSVDQAMKFQKSLNTIAVATDRTTKQTAASAKGLESIAKSTGTGLQQLTDSYYVASKSGLSVAKSLAVTKAAAQGAKAENADLGTVTDALTSVMASYGKTLKNPVAAMNMIIKSSGLAKTTTQDFSASLSNVVPIASSLGISFDQIGGAIATMTQHGETAQRATDNLSNLITNLAGQNNVASQSLQQLGINTIDLSRNLGKRGLTGSLDLVLGKIAKSSQSGLVVTTAFKKAAVATASLNTEVDALPKSMQKNAKEFVAGKMSYKDFYTFTKSLGGQQFALGKDLITTQRAASGFNGQLKSGNSTTRTLASTLQKALGGVTGMRVALMLSGASAKTFADDTKKIGKAAGETKGDVLGWSKTQGTLAVKMDKAKASIQVLAVEIGTALIPVVSKIADMVSKAVGWFDRLSGTQKKILLWSVGVLAALGPILSIGGRLALVGRGIGTFVGGTAARLATLAGASEAASLRIGTAMRTAGAALGGAGIGFALGSLTRNSSTTTKAISTLGSTAIGATIGFGAGGPVGAAVGGLAGGLTALATNFLNTGSSADQAGKIAQAALLAQKQAADSLLGSLQSVNGAYTGQYKAQVISQLDKNGALSLGSKAGVGPKSVVNFALGQASTQQMTAFTLAVEHARDTGKITDAQMQKLWKSIGSVGGAAASAERKFELENAAAGRSVLTHKQLGVGITKLEKVIVSGGRSLNGETASAVRNRAVIVQNIKAVDASAASQLRHGKSVKSVAADYRTQMGTLKFNLQQMGFTGAEVDRLVAKYSHIPKRISTSIDANTTPAMTKLNALLAKIPKGTYHYNVVADYKKHKAGVGGYTGGTVYRDAIRRDTGGTVPGSGPGNVDSVPAMLAPGEEVIRTAAARKHRPLLKAINAGIAGFAKGGTVKPNTQAIGTAIGTVGQAYTKPLDLASVGYARIRNQIAHATAVLDQQIRRGLSKHSAASFRHEIRSLTAEANKQLRDLRVKIRSSDVTAIKRALGKTVSDTRQAFSAMLADVVKQATSKSMVGLFRNLETRVTGVQSKLISARNKLSGMQQYRNGIQSTLTGSFDSTQYGSVTDLVSGFGGATGTNNAYASELTGLRKRAGKNKTLLGYINQLAASGQTATLQTLSGASGRELGQVSKAVSAYNRSVGSGDNAAVLAKYGGKSIASQHKTVDSLDRQVSDLTGAVADLAASVGKFAQRPINLDSKHFMDMTDREIEAAIKKLTLVKQHGRK